MEENEAVAAFTALVHPLAWLYRVVPVTSVHDGYEEWWTHLETEQKECVCSVVTTQENVRWCDDAGTPYRAGLSAEFTWLSYDAAGDVSIAAWARWSFPCRTVEEARAICERLVVTEDRTEMDGLDGLLYPLTWSGWADDKEQWQQAWIMRNQNPVARYRVPDDICWASDDFTAQYEVVVSEDVRLSHGLYPASQSPFRYASLAEATAACDRHYRTGNWE